MAVKSKRLKLSTKGRDQVIDITGEVAEAVTNSEIKNGTVTVFIFGVYSALNSYHVGGSGATVGLLHFEGHPISFR